MKPIRLLALLLVSTLTAFPQTNTYPFPASGNVGIGTSSPQYRLDIFGPAGDHPARVATPHGFLIFGPANDGWSHFQTDRPHFYFNRGLWVDSGRVGSYDEDLLLQTAGTTRIFVSNTSGDVGMGTTTPRSALQVLGPITAGSSGGSTQGIDYLYGLYGSGKLFVAGSQYSSAASFLGYAVKAKPGAVGYLSSTEIPAGRSAIEASTGHIAFLTGAPQTSTDGGSVDIAERVRINQNGDVGIGTTNPGSKLDIGGPTGATYGTLTIKQAASGQKGIWLQSYENHNALSIHHTGGYAVVSTDYTGSGSSVPLALQVTGGNVGIGTTNPMHKLAVNGTVKAKEVIVETTGWSDYVFADDYALQPLSEVEAHIKTNKHLPGIPSAAQVAEQGVSVGDMQARLLAKIEEPTLHLIAQEKELAALGEKNARLQARVQNLEAR